MLELCARRFNVEVMRKRIYEDAITSNMDFYWPHLSSSALALCELSSYFRFRKQIGLQIDAPSRASSPLPSSTDMDLPANGPNLPKPLTLEEKKYLLAVERGDLPNVRR